MVKKAHKKLKPAGRHTGMNSKQFLKLLFVILLGACTPEKEEKPPRQEQPVKKEEVVFKPVAPAFSADSAYFYIQRQVDFGPRVPGSEPHRKTAGYIISKLQQFGWHVQKQEFTAVTFNNKRLPAVNIIASLDTNAVNQVLLMAHWDTRPFADQDDADRTKPILGANDGGSGVGVLLEAARVMAQNPPAVGVDIILFDAEDYGQPEATLVQRKNDTYCLGSQHWSGNPHKTGYSPRFGILLDMVGAKDATFTKEGTSVYYAAPVVDKVWGIATRLGYGNFFVNQYTDPITDDHAYVNAIAGIPSIDIIEYDESTPTNFGSYWHTHDDNMEIIDTLTLKAVGQTVLETIYREK